MNRNGPSPWRWLGWLLLVGMLAVALATAVSLAAMFSHLPPDLVVTVDGEQIDVHGMAAGHAWLAFGSVLLAFVLMLAVVPLALLFGVGLPLLLAALGVVVALLCAGVAVAIVGSPVILLGLLLWWALRPRRPQAMAPPAAAAPPRVPVIGQHTDNNTPFA